MHAGGAAALLPNDLLLLDELTNYLDLEGALWLVARLKTIEERLIISHDRELPTIRSTQSCI